MGFLRLWRSFATEGICRWALEQAFVRSGHQMQATKNSTGNYQHNFSDITSA